MTVSKTAPRSTAADLVMLMSIVLRCALSVPLAVVFAAGVVLMVSSKLALGFLQSFWEVE